MAIDFSRLVSSVDRASVEPRDIFMALPNKDKSYGYPRDVQTEVWKQWFDRRNEKNIIIKMNTGSGKTTVGLTILQSCLNEGKGPAVYVVPDNYLVSQVCSRKHRNSAYVLHMTNMVKLDFALKKARKIISLRIKKPFLSRVFINL